MSEVKDQSIKLFGRTIAFSLIPNDNYSSPHQSPFRPSPSSSPPEVSSATQHEAEVRVLKNHVVMQI